MVGLHTEQVDLYFDQIVMDSFHDNKKIIKTEDFFEEEEQEHFFHNYCRIECYFGLDPSYNFDFDNEKELNDFYLIL